MLACKGQWATTTRVEHWSPCPAWFRLSHGKGGRKAWSRCPSSARPSNASPPTWRSPETALPLLLTLSLSSNCQPAEVLGAPGTRVGAPNPVRSPAQASPPGTVSNRPRRGYSLAGLEEKKKPQPGPRVRPKNAGMGTGDPPQCLARETSWGPESNGLRPQRPELSCSHPGDLLWLRKIFTSCFISKVF